MIRAVEAHLGRAPRGLGEQCHRPAPSTRRRIRTRERRHLGLRVGSVPLSVTRARHIPQREIQSALQICSTVRQMAVRPTPRTSMTWLWDLSIQGGKDVRSIQFARYVHIFIIMFCYLRVMPLVKTVADAGGQVDSMRP